MENWQFFEYFDLNSSALLSDKRANELAFFVDTIGNYPLYK